MAAVLKVVQSQEMLNCSQDADSSPIPKSLPVSGSFVSKSQATQGTAKSDDSTQVVKESLEHIPRRETRASPRIETARPSACDLPEEGEEELYEVTPKPNAKEQPSQSLVQEPTQGHMRSRGARLFTNFETQKKLTETADRASEELLSDDIAEPAGIHQATAPTKLKLLTQTSASDKLQPALLSSFDPPAEKISSSNSHGSHSQSGNSRNNSTTSQNSTMVSATKTAADKLKQPEKKANAPASTLGLLRAKCGKAPVCDTRDGAVQQATNVVPVEDQPQYESHIGNVLEGPPGSLSRPDTVALIETTASGAGLQDAVTAKLKPRHKTNPFVEDNDSEHDKPVPGMKVTATKAKGAEAAQGQVDVEKESQLVPDGMRKPRDGALRRAPRSEQPRLETGKGNAEGSHAVSTQMLKKVTTAGVSTRYLRKPAKQAKKVADSGDDEFEIKSSANEEGDTMVKKRKGTSSAKAAFTENPATTTGRTRARAAAQRTKKPTQSIDNQQELPAVQVPSTEQKPRHAVGSDTEGECDGVPADVRTHIQKIKTKPRKGSFVAEPHPPGPSKPEDMSQEQAIVISDDHSSSSLAHTPALEVPTLQEDHHPDAARQSVQPKTPANMRSSPPVISQDVRDEDMRILQNTMRSRKPEMIAFDKSGPRNQGSVAVKTPGSRSIKYGQLSLRYKNNATGPPSAKSKLEHKRRAGPSSIAHSVRPAIAYRRAASSNKADDVSEALADFRGTNMQSKPRFQMSPDTQNAFAIDKTHESHSVVHGERLATDDGLVNINDDAENGSDDVILTAGLEDLTKAKSAKPTIISQQIPRPPAKLESTTYRTPATVHQPLHSTAGALHGATKSRVVERSKAPVDAPATSGTAQARQISADQVNGTKVADRVLRSKRARAEETHDGRDLQRAKNNLDNERPPTTTKAGKTSAATTLRETAMAPPAPIKPSHTSMKTAAPSKPTSKLSGFVASVRSAHAHKTPKPGQRGPRKASRRETGFEGSPAPEGVAIQDGLTVLETYSQQQIGLLSEPTFVEDMIKKHRYLSRPELSPSDRSSNHANVEDVEDVGNSEDVAREDDENDKRPSSHRPGLLSSNMKPVPAEPQSGSRLIPRLELSQSESEQIFAGETRVDLVDPFIVTAADTDSTQNSENPIAAHNLGSRIEAKLDHMTGAKAIHHIREASPNVLQTTRQKPLDKASHIQLPAQVPVTSRSDSNIEPEEFQAETALKRDRARRMQEDPNRTLVNDEPQVRLCEPVKASKRKQAGTVREDDDYEDQQTEVTQHAGDCEPSDPASDDLMSWRKSLKPRQLNLFEELIKTARRMTDYFVEQENGLVRTLEKCHQQELYMVKQVEMARAKQYETRLEELNEARKKSKKEYRRVKANMESRLQAKKLERQKRYDVAVKRQEENDELEQMISKLS